MPCLNKILSLLHGLRAGYKNATWRWCEPTCHCLEHRLFSTLSHYYSTWILNALLKFQAPSYNGFWDMNFYPVESWQTDRRTDRQTDRKRCIRAHRAICTGGLKKVGPEVIISMFNLLLDAHYCQLHSKSRTASGLKGPPVLTKHGQNREVSVNINHTAVVKEVDNRFGSVHSCVCLYSPRWTVSPLPFIFISR